MQVQNSSKFVDFTSAGALLFFLKVPIKFCRNISANSDAAQRRRTRDSAHARRKTAAPLAIAGETGRLSPSTIHRSLFTSRRSRTIHHQPLEQVASTASQGQGKRPSAAKVREFIGLFRHG
jgi:hypothetical protein